jgi:Ca2+-binding EF-hand superfamily protein
VATKRWSPEFRRLTLIPFIVGALMLGADVVLGQGAAGGFSEEAFRKHAENFFKNRDQDQDGVLQGDEIPRDIRRILAQARARADTRINLPQFLKYRAAAYLLQVAASFKRRDRNEDGFLQKHEMPSSLMKQLAQYSRGDRVNLQEFLQFSGDHDFPSPPPPPKATDMAQRAEPSAPLLIQIDQTGQDRRPTVYRPGKLPKGLPDWFEALDTDQDGQIALFEWHTAGKSLDAFPSWDRNDDGVVTIQEILHKLKEDLSPSSSLLLPPASLPQPRPRTPAIPS